MRLPSATVPEPSPALARRVRNYWVWPRVVARITRLVPRVYTIYADVVSLWLNIKSGYTNAHSLAPDSVGLRAAVIRSAIVSARTVLMVAEQSAHPRTNVQVTSLVRRRPSAIPDVFVLVENQNSASLPHSLHFVCLPRMAAFRCSAAVRRSTAGAASRVRSSFDTLP